MLAGKYNVFKKIYEFIIDTINMMGFLLSLLLTEDFVDHVKRTGSNNMCISKKLVVLGNGPSMREVLQVWEDNENFKDVDFLVVNYFCCDENFTKIRPKYYVLTDPSFYIKASLSKVNKMYEELNDRVTWKMFLYIQYYGYKSIDWSEKITNENIKVIPFHGIQYFGYSSLRNYFYSKGLVRGNVGTVVLTGELIGLNLGYKKLYLYGVDHNFFDALCLNEENQLCNVKTYFYDNKQELKPLSYIDNSGNEIMHTVSSFLQDKLNLFQGHEHMRSYADYCSAKIYNCTKNSLIDAYEKL